jgi:hypothetical protein
MEFSSHRIDCASEIVSAFIVSDCSSVVNPQRWEYVRSCMDTDSGVCLPKTVVFICIVVAAFRVIKPPRERLFESQTEFAA